MKNSEKSTNQGPIGLQITPLELNNKTFIADHQMAVSNSNQNTLVLGTVMPGTIHPNSTTLNASFGNSRPVNLPEVKNYNLTILTKPPASSATSNLVSQLTLNTCPIKVVSLSKCSNINKDFNLLSNNTPYLQLTTPIISTNSTSLNDHLTTSSASNKSDNINSMNSVLNSTATILPNSTQSAVSNAVTSPMPRLILQNAHTQLLPHGANFALLPSPTSDIVNSTQLQNNQLIKNSKYVLAGKQTTQTIRSISAASTPIVSQANIGKQSVNIISPTKSINSIDQSLNTSEGSGHNSDRSVIRNHLNEESTKSSSKIQPVKIPLSSYSLSQNSNNNIRVALTSNSKIHFISNSRKREGSPLNLLQDSKSKDSSYGIKNENHDNAISYNSHMGNYSPTRKRARKQHLKSVGTRSQKSVLNPKIVSTNNYDSTNNSFNSPKSVVNDLNNLTPQLALMSTSKITNLPVTTNKSDDTPSTAPSTQINQKVILRKPIQICSAKSSANSSFAQRPTSIISTNVTSITNNNSNSNTSSPAFSQFQIIAQNPRQLILSPKSTKPQAPFSPQKVIHIASSPSNNRIATTIKSEKLSCDSSIEVTTKSIKIENKTVDDKKEIATPEIQIESHEDHLKYSLFPFKYQWNPRRNHFEKESDVKFRKTKPSVSSKYPPNSDFPDENMSESDIEICDTSWFLFKASNQMLMQKNFDEENLEKLYLLKNRFHIVENKDSLSEPNFKKICTKSFSLPVISDQINLKVFADFVDPHKFGISDDVTDCHINTILKKEIDKTFEEISDEPHVCSDSCIYYSTEIAVSHPPPKVNGIVDLIEGLIVKEKLIISKETEISDHCIKLLRNSSDFSSVNIKHNKQNDNNSEKINGRRR